MQSGSTSKCHYNPLATFFADGVPTIRALTSLNLASNNIGAKGAKHVAEAIKGHVSALQFD